MLLQMTSKFVESIRAQRLKNYLDITISIATPRLIIPTQHSLKAGEKAECLVVDLGKFKFSTVTQRNEEGEFDVKSYALSLANLRYTLMCFLAIGFFF
jgi:hypothetical protein